jgi:hypothetical protein
LAVFQGENALLRKVERHDQYQFEVKLDYPLDPDAADQRYVVEAYFFIPEQLGVNAHTYPPQSFYRDVRDYIRFKTPQMTLAQLAEPENALSPLARLMECDQRLKKGGWSEEAVRTLAYESKMLARVLRASLRDLVQLIADALWKGRAIDRRDAARLGEEAFDRLEEILARYRAIGDDLLNPGVPRDALGVHRLVDEFLSLTSESFALHLVDILWEAPGLKERAVKLAADEVAYRKARGYPSIASVDSDNEVFLYRHKLLKKFTGNVLYLQIHQQDARAPVQNLIFAVAAGLAMAFAVAVSFLSFGLAQASWTVFFVLVVSYMLKDRLKEWIRMVLSRWLDRLLYDHKIQITDSATGERIGEFRQKFEFIPLSEVPKGVRRVRGFGRTESLAERELTEQVLVYHKAVHLRPRRVFGRHKRVAALTDIFRFNVRSLLYSMDEPVQEVELLDPALGVAREVPAARTYHLSVILRIGRVGSSDPKDYRKLRVVLDRNGIKRVEQVALGALDSLGPEAA